MAKKTREELINAMIQHVKEMLDREYVHFTRTVKADKRILSAYAVMIEVLKEQLKEGDSLKVLEPKATNDDGYYKAEKEWLAKGYTVVHDLPLFELCDQISSRILDKVGDALEKYYYYDANEYADVMDYYVKKHYIDFQKTFRRIFFNDFDVLSGETRWGVLIGFKTPERFDALKYLDGYVFYSTKTKRVY